MPEGGAEPGRGLAVGDEAERFVELEGLRVRGHVDPFDPRGGRGR